MDESMEKYQTIKVGSVMSNEFYTIDPGATIEDAVSLLSEKDTNLLVVCTKENFPVGILTERDIVIRVLGAEKKPSETLVEDVMTSPVRTCSPNTSITDAMRQMAKKKLRQLLVVNEGILVGVFLARDALAVAPELIDTLAELVSVRGEESKPIEEGASGYCDECEEYSDDLKLIDSRYYCEYCREALELERTEED
jgi:CBS domain-containing protein